MLETSITRRRQWLFILTQSIRWFIGNKRVNSNLIIAILQNSHSHEVFGSNPKNLTYTSLLKVNFFHDPTFRLNSLRKWVYTYTIDIRYFLTLVGSVMYVSVNFSHIICNLRRFNHLLISSSWYCICENTCFSFTRTIRLSDMTLPLFVHRASINMRKAFSVGKENMNWNGAYVTKESVDSCEPSLRLRRGGKL